MTGVVCGFLWGVAEIEFSLGEKVCGGWAAAADVDAGGGIGSDVELVAFRRCCDGAVDDWWRWGIDVVERCFPNFVGVSR